ncbi:MAG: SRPBCC family protein [Bacteroidales bacterium]|jgi:hypothetical protein|nr:SRPBCC family protein [Bacteroidales bacterium]
MVEEVRGKTIVLDKPPQVIYSAFSDMRNILANIPEDKRDSVKFDSDTILTKIQGFEIGLRVRERIPFSKINFEQYGNSPFPFSVTLHISSTDDGKTNFYIELRAELNSFMKMMIGGKLQELVDKITEQFATASTSQISQDITSYVS